MIGVYCQGVKHLVLRCTLLKCSDVGVCAALR